MLTQNRVNDFQQSVMDKPLVHVASEYASALKVAVMKRLLLALQETGGMRMTNLAVRTRMNYNKCVKYVKLMALLQWVEVISDKGKYYVVLDQRGRETIELLSNVS